MFVRSNIPQWLIISGLLFLSGVEFRHVQAQTGISAQPPYAGNLAVWRALSTVTSIEAVEMPLVTFVEKLRNQHQINIVLDRHSLEGAAASVDIPVSCSVKNISLRHALEFALRDLPLTFIVDKEAVIILAQDDSENRPLTVVYPVRDLVTFRHQGNWVEDYEPLIEVIRATVAQPKPGWVDDGGVGTVVPFAGGAIVCSQVQPVHEDLEYLLAALRTALKRMGNPPLIYRDPNALQQLLPATPLPLPSLQRASGYQPRANPYRLPGTATPDSSPARSRQNSSNTGGLFSVSEMPVRAKPLAPSPVIRAAPHGAGWLIPQIHAPAR